MTISSIGSGQSGAVQRPHHHHQGGSAGQTGTAGATGDATPSLADGAASRSGIGKFASELQSILLSAQSGQPSPATTANDPSTASDPQGASDVTAPSGQGHGGGGIKHLADRLQDLLGDTGTTGTTGTTPSATAANGNGLQDVLARLQATLQQTLANYQSASATPAAGTSITA